MKPYNFCNVNMRKLEKKKNKIDEIQVNHSVGTLRFHHK